MRHCTHAAGAGTPSPPQGRRALSLTLARRGYAFLSAREEGAARHAALAAEAGGALHTDGGHGLRCYG